MEVRPTQFWRFALDHDPRLRHDGAVTPSAGGNAIVGTFRAALADDEWAALLALGRRRSYPSGQTLMFEGDPGDFVVVLLSGRVKVVRVSADGRERVLSIRDHGDVVGELSVLDGEPRVGTVIAVEPVEALILTADTFRRHLESTPRVAVALLEAISRRFRETTIKRSQLGASDTVGRLAARLVELVDRYGTPHEDGVVIALPLTQEEIGSWAVGSPAGIAKALQTMREHGWIETERKRIIVRDLAAVRNRAG